MSRNQKTLTPAEATEAEETTVDVTDTTVTVDSATTANTNNSERKAKISKFAEPEYNAPISNICICQVINHMEAEKVGLFIKEKNLGTTDWQGNEPTHKHTFSNGTPETGIFLQSPRMHILDISPRYIEQREDGAIIGIYEYDDGYDMYQALGKDKVVLRRFYLINLVDENNKKLHNKPIVLSIKGVASSKFGEAYKQFQRELEIAFARYTESPVAEKRAEFHRLGIFHPTFAPSLEPKEEVNPKNKSWVAIVTSYKSPNPNGSDFTKFFCEDKEAEFETFIQANPEFSHRIGKTSAVIAEHLRLAGHDPSAPALPPANITHALPSAVNSNEVEDLPY